MALKIIRAADPIRVERLILCVYGPPGLGKTSLGFTAEAPITLDFDHGAHRAANRGDSVRVTSWTEVAEMTAEDFEPYRTVIVDTAGRALDSLTADIIRRNPKAGRGGALTLQGYGTLKSEFVAWLKLLNSFGKDVVLIAHMDEQRNGDDIIERLDVQGGSKGEIYKAADAMGRLLIRDGKRWLNFSPTDAAFGKNPAAMDAMVVPHPSIEPAFLAGVISAIKGRLNELSEEQRAAQKELDEWRERISGMNDAASFNAAMADVKSAPKAARSLYTKAAEAAGLAFDKAKNEYVAKAASAEVA